MFQLRKKFRESTFNRLIWLFFALFIFNFSIDVPDTDIDSVSEDLAYNDIESISEFVLESVLGFENIIPEHDEDDSDEKRDFYKKVDLYNQQQVSLNQQQFIVFTIKNQQFFIATASPKTPFLSGLIKPPQA
jgi:hypothetical protein